MNSSCPGGSGGGDGGSGGGDGGGGDGGGDGLIGMLSSVGLPGGKMARPSILALLADAFITSVMLYGPPAGPAGVQFHDGVYAAFAPTCQNSKRDVAEQR